MVVTEDWTDKRTEGKASEDRVVVMDGCRSGERQCGGAERRDGDSRDVRLRQGMRRGILGEEICRPRPDDPWRMIKKRTGGPAGKSSFPVRRKASGRQSARLW